MAVQADLAQAAGQPSPQWPPKYGSQKKAPKKSCVPALHKVITNNHFRACRGLEKILSEGFMGNVPRARLVPRGLPRGRGTGMPKRSRISTFLVPGTHSACVFCRSEKLASQIYANDPQADTQRAASDSNAIPAPTCGGALPFSPRKGK